jgi:hypothetical protein
MLGQSKFYSKVQRTKAPRRHEYASVVEKQWQLRA